MTLAQAAHYLPRFKDDAHLRLLGYTFNFNLNFAPVSHYLKPDNANHGILIANYIGISYNALVQHLMNLHEQRDSLTDIYQTGKLRYYQPRLLSYCEPHKQSTHYIQVLISQM